MIHPFSKTRMEFTRDRIQHYSLDEHTCCSCGHRYFPKVLSQTYLMQFGMMPVVVVGYVFVAGVLPKSAFSVLIGVVWILAAWTLIKSRSKTRTPGTKWGDLVFECPACGSVEARIEAKSGAADRDRDRT